MPSQSRDFYPPEYTARSRAVLDRMHQGVPDAVLIGGWATWVRTGGAMSHDIDLIVTRAQLAAIRTMTEEMSESRHLGGRKWRASADGIHLDLYVPHQSRLGQHLQLRTERLVDRHEVIKGWLVLDLPGHVATKFAALLDRPDTNPGEKDRDEIMALLAQGIEPAEAVRVLHDASMRTAEEVSQLIGRAYAYLGDLSLSRDDRRHLNQLASQWQALSVSLERQGLTHAPEPPHLPRERRRGPGLSL